MKLVDEDEREEWAQETSGMDKKLFMHSTSGQTLQSSKQQSETKLKITRQMNRHFANHERLLVMFVAIAAAIPPLPLPLPVPLPVAVSPSFSIVVLF